MAQHVCGVSGVVAIVVCGLYISLNYEACIAPESQVPHGVGPVFSQTDACYEGRSFQPVFSFFFEPCPLFCFILFPAGVGQKSFRSCLVVAHGLAKGLCFCIRAVPIAKYLECSAVLLPILS